MAVEKDLLNSVPGSETVEIAATETSDSHSIILSPQTNNQPCDGNSAACLNPKYKGAVQQQNGHWGAQIYANHQRIWLGTFKSSEEAALAYDRAAIKLRSGDPHRNFPLNQKSREEHEFQSRLSTEVVLAMIKDGTYRDKLSEYISTMSSDEHENENGSGCPRVVLFRNPNRCSFQQLFQKELTPSDVGKLNRLVIPKKYAIKFFPRISRKSDVAGAEGMQLVFYDREMSSWSFRYCYWSSSHSFVFTKGWNRFVKAKELGSGDVIGFYDCLCNDLRREGKTFWMINVVRRETKNVALEGKGTVDVGMEKQQQQQKQKGFKLFGVEIN